MNSTSNIFSKLTSNDGINFINVGLMLISLLAAFVLPFELFLFSYAILGPLHYLTEISWLENKNYFIKSKKDIWLLVLLVIIISYGVYSSSVKINQMVGSLMFLGFIYALIVLFVEKTAIKTVLILLAFMLSISASFNTYPETPYLIFAVWLPTIIHVYLFTGAFILFGALKSRSKSGIFSFVVFIACAFVFFTFIPDNFGWGITEYGKKVYPIFKTLNISLYNLFGFGELKSDAVLFFGPKSIAIMRFIAFAYTYHYLNWFSKTTVIKWNDISKKRMGIIISLWILSVALYLFNYKVGFYALFLLSMLHVFLEFPLNHFSFLGIGKELKAILKK